MNGPCVNTDRDLWQEREGDVYSARVFLTKGGGIGMDVGGLCIVKPIRDWHALAKPGVPWPERPEELQEAIELIRIGAGREGYRTFPGGGGI